MNFLAQLLSARERDERRAIYREKVGSGSRGSNLDIALDPFEGQLLRLGQPNSISVMAIAEGKFLNAPDTYMEKSVSLKGKGVIDLESPTENLGRLAVRKCRIQDLTAVILKGRTRYYSRRERVPELFNW